MKKNISRLVTFLILLLLTAVVVPTNVAAVNRVSNFEWMSSAVFPPTAVASDIIVGWHNYGVLWRPGDNPSNAHDLRGIWQPGDTVTINILCNAFNSGEGGRSVHYFSLEVYDQQSWAQQGNPDYTDWWQIQYPGGQVEWDQDVISVLIPAAACGAENHWCIYYTCEAVDLDHIGLPPYFDIDYQNYWILLW